MQQQQQHYYYRLCIIKIYTHYKIYIRWDDQQNVWAALLLAAAAAVISEAASCIYVYSPYTVSYFYVKIYNTDTHRNTQLCGTTAAVVTPQYVYFRIFYYIFCTFSVLHSSLRAYVRLYDAYWGDFDCQNNLCVIFADRRQIHTSTTCLSFFVNTCALTVVVMAPVLNGNRMEIEWKFFVFVWVYNHH